MNLPRSMNVVRADRVGTAAALRLVDTPVPRPGPGQVLIRVESASVNFADVKRRRGDDYPFPTAYPFVPGSEVAGTIAALGAGSDGFSVGQSVFALVGGDGQGGYGQFALAYSPQVTALPPGMDFDTASGIVVAGATAMLLVRQAARLQAGESVLVPAATGAVGSLLVQLARHTGANCIIAAISPVQRKTERAIQCGAHATVDYTRADWASKVTSLTGGRGVDVLFEASGGPVLEQGLRALAPFGRAVVYGAASGRPATLGERSIVSLLYDPVPNQSLTGFNVGTWFMQRPDVAGSAIGELMGLIAAGAIRMPEITTMPLRDAAKAHELLEARQATGKLVLKPWN